LSFSLCFNMISSQSVPSNFWFQGFRDGASFGLTRHPDGLGIEAHDDELEIDLEPIGNSRLDGSEGMQLYVPVEGPPYIYLRDTSRRFDIQWAPVALVVSSKDTSINILPSPVAPIENNRIVFGQTSQYETGRVEREMKVVVPGYDGLFTAYHDITYTVQFIRRPGVTFSKSRLCDIDDSMLASETVIPSAGQLSDFQVPFTAAFPHTRQRCCPCLSFRDCGVSCNPLDWEEGLHGALHLL